ncbi:MAG: hypothetical protein ACOC2H_04920 [Spirochaetota bacterium]
MSEESEFLQSHNIFLKTKFKSTARNIYGLELINFNPNGTIDSIHVIASTFSEIYDIDPHSGWEQYEEKIIHTQWSGKFNQHITRDLQIQFEGMLEDTFLRTQLFEAANDYDFGTSEQIIFDGLKRILQDKNLKIEVNIQEATEEEIQSVRQNREKERQAQYQKPEEEEFDIEEGAALLPASLILAPVNGKPLYDVRIGDKIMIKLDPKSAKNQHFISQYQLKTDNNTYLPIPAEVIDIKAPSKKDPIQILTRIEESVYAKSIEEERQVKLRMFNPASDRSIRQIKGVTGQVKPHPHEQIQTQTERESGSGMTIILSIALAMLLFVLIVAIYMLL